MKEQALAAGVEIAYETVTGVDPDRPGQDGAHRQGQLSGRPVILANGGTPRKLGIPGEAELAGHGIGLNAAKDGADYAGRNIYVVGGADGAVKEALYLASLAKKLTIIHFEDQLGCIPEFREKVAAAGNIELRPGLPASTPSPATSGWIGWRLPARRTAPLRRWRTRAAASLCTPV